MSTHVITYFALLLTLCGMFYIFPAAAFDGRQGVNPWASDQHPLPGFPALDYDPALATPLSRRHDASSAAHEPIYPPAGYLPGLPRRLPGTINRRDSVDPSHRLYDRDFDHAQRYHRERWENPERLRRPYYDDADHAQRYHRERWENPEHLRRPYYDDADHAQRYHRERWENPEHLRRPYYDDADPAQRYHRERWENPERLNRPHEYRKDSDLHTRQHPQRDMMHHPHLRDADRHLPFSGLYIPSTGLLDVPLQPYPGIYPGYGANKWESTHTRPIIIHSWNFYGIPTPGSQTPQGFPLTNMPWSGLDHYPWSTGSGHNWGNLNPLLGSSALWGALPGSASPWGALPGSASTFGALPGSASSFGALPGSASPFGALPGSASSWGTSPWMATPFSTAPFGSFGGFPLWLY